MAKNRFTSKYTGEQIEELLDNINNKPIYPHYDQSDGYWRIFSKRENYELWESDPARYSELVIWEFEGKTPREIVLSGLSDKYIIKGETGTTITYDFWTEESSGAINREAITVNYIFNNEGNIQSQSAVYAAGTHVNFNVDRFLREGSNVITMFVKGRSTNATKTVVLTYNVVELEIESSFEVARAIQPGSSIPVYYRSKAQYPRTVNFYIDGVSVGTIAVNASEPTDNMKLYSIANNYSSGKHTLQLNTVLTLDSFTFTSKTLYYEFVVTGGVQNQISIATELSKETILVNTTPTINAEQYKAVEIHWGYYNSNAFQQTASVEWKLVPQGGGEGEVLRTLTASVVEVENDKAPAPLLFVPTTVGDYTLQAVINDVVVSSYPLTVIANTNGITEQTSQMMLKLQALGRSNTEPGEVREEWSYNNGQATIATTFSNVMWNAMSGWDGKTLNLYGGATAEIGFEPFKANNASNYSPQVNGCTVEIEFETYNVEQDDIELIKIGTPGSGYISVKATSAEITSRLGATIKTNFKSNERVKLAFIVMPNDERLSSERRLMYIVNNGILERSKSYTQTDTFNTTGTIRIGDSQGKAGIKVHNIRCYYKALTVNEAWNNSVIDDIEHIVERLDENDVYTAGGSTLNVEKVSAKIPTMLITGNVDQLINASNKTTIVCDAEFINPDDPERNFTLKTANFRNHGQSTLGMPVPSIKFWSGKDRAKMYDADGKQIEGGRYSFKEGAMPMKKWVLQANYMDSTGCHNGSLLRLMSSTWENANVGNIGYALRTPPQEYAHDTYPTVMGKEFPYAIRTGADSMPCVVFWRKNEQTPYSFLGQYVFMDDKKSDYVYGNRSIYDIPDDPFGFTHSKDGATRLWDNSNVFQWELLRNNHDLNKFKDASNFWGAPTESDDELVNDGDSEGGNGNNATHDFEQAFELIYPDPDDLTSEEYIAAAEKLEDFMLWICGTYQKDNGGSQSQAKFESEVSDHMDIYKMAAYYVFLMRFGLVDNSVRNAQLKTYDGEKWWFEPWDMDIANGKRNDGFLVFDPRIDRQTTDPDNPSSYAFAGHDCWLWNALEGWGYWKNTVVPQVAQALYNSGLNYANAIEMMDEAYCNRWCDKLYNESGKFKYVDQYLSGRSEGFLSYLQGKGQSHRHWWLKTNMDYYDAKWAIGDYTAKPFYFRIFNTPAGLTMYFKAAETNYFGWALTSTIQESGKYITAGNTFTFTNANGLAVNDPVNIFAAPSIGEVDLHEFFEYFSGTFFLEAFNDEVNGTKLTKLVLGASMDDLEEGLRNTTSSINLSGLNKLTRLSYLDLRGWSNMRLISGFNECTSIKTLLAAGSGLTTFNPPSGTHFEYLELPDTIESLDLEDVDWDELHICKDLLRNGGSVEEGESTIEEVDSFVACTSIRFRNMGNSANVMEFVASWAEYMSESDNLEHVSVYMTGINWTGVSVETLLKIAMIPTAQRTLQGYAKISGTVTGEEITLLKNAYGEEVFNVNSTFVIDAQSGFIMSAESEMLSGETQTITGVSFPLSEIQRVVQYKLQLYNGVTYEDVPVAEIDGERRYIWRNVVLHEDSGLLETTESSYDTHTVYVQGIDQETFANSRVEIEITSRSYPSNVAITGERNILTSGYYTFNATFTPSETNGSIVAYDWSIGSDTRFSVYSETADKLILMVNSVDASVVEKTITYEVSFANGSSLSATKGITFHQPQNIMTLVSNSVALNAFYLQGLSAHDNYMTDVEAWSVTDISFLSGNTELLHFDELPNFKNLTEIDLSGCTALGSGSSKTLDASTIDAESVDLSGTKVEGITLKENSSLTTITYSDYTTEVSLINQDNLEELDLTNVDNSCDITIDGCDNLETLNI